MRALSLRGECPFLLTIESVERIKNYDQSFPNAPSLPTQFVWICNPDAIIIRICNPIKQNRIKRIVNPDILFAVGLQIRQNGERVSQPSQNSPSSQPLSFSKAQKRSV